MTAHEISTDIPGDHKGKTRMLTDIPGNLRNNQNGPGRRPPGLNFFTDMHGEAGMCSRTTEMGYTDNKDASRTTRTGFIDRFVVSHTALETTERHFLMNDRLYKAT